MVAVDAKTLSKFVKAYLTQYAECMNESVIIGINSLWAFQKTHIRPV
jgi:hypothetical protein